jgi:regulator of chromosome condensation
VWSWGTYKDIAGYIGYDQKTDKQVVPTMVPGLENIVAIGAGENHDIALTTKGQVYEWGDPRTAGRVSDRLKRTKLVPRQIHFDKKKAVPMANVWACGLASFTKSTNGQCFSWGINNWGQLGDNSRVNRGNPTEITTFNNKDIIKIVGGQHHTLALSADGTVYSWGRAHYGRLGQGKPADPTGKWSDLDDRLIPTDIPNLTCCVSIAAGETHSLAVTKDGSLFAWGSNDLHQLGLNNDQDIHTPTKVDTQYHITDAAAGSQHSIVLC